MAILDHLSEWLLPTLPNPVQGELACSFIFRAGAQLRQDDYAIISEPGSSIAHLVPQLSFINHASAMQECYISKLPLAAPDAPLSRQLLNSQEVTSLERKPLSLVLGEAMRTGLISRNLTDAESFCWSLMDHVTLYPYFHPDGYIRGTRHFQDWRLSMQKQYAMLLYKQFVLRERLSTLYKVMNDSAHDCLGPHARPAVDMYGREAPAKVHPMQQELEKVEKENMDVCRKVDQFRAEQKMLQKAYLRLVEVCSAEGLFVPANTWSKASRNPVTILRPLNPAHKRRAEEVILPRSSASRDRPDHKFSKQQKKQLRVLSEVHESPKFGGKLTTAVHGPEDIANVPNFPRSTTTTDSSSAAEVEHYDIDSVEDDTISAEDHSLSDEDASESVLLVIETVGEHASTINEDKDRTPSSGDESPSGTESPCTEDDIGPPIDVEVAQPEDDMEPTEDNVPLSGNATQSSEVAALPVEGETESVEDEIAADEEKTVPIEGETTLVEKGTTLIENLDATQVESDDTASSEEWEEIKKEDIEFNEDASSDKESSSEVDATSDQSITLVPIDLLADELSEHLNVEVEEVATPQKQDSDSSIGDIDSTLGELYISRNLIQGVCENFAEQLQRSVNLNALEDLEATLAGVQWEFEYVSTVQDEIKKVLEVAPARGELTADEVANAIPGAGKDYMELVDMFEYRVPDNQVGFATLRELIDEAGFVDAVSGMVYKRGPVEFGNIDVD